MIKQNKRLEQCILALWFPFSRAYKFMSVASVPSLTGTAIYEVRVEDHKSVSCTCKGNKTFKKYCVHMQAVDVIHAPMIVAEAPLENYDIVGEALKVFNDASRVIDQAVLDAKIGDAYEVEGPKKNVTFPSAKGSCGHLVHPKHEGTPCGACLCK